MAQHKVYTFYAELKDYKPKIWREFQIDGNKTVAELGYALMAMFEMTASHLFCFCLAPDKKCLKVISELSEDDSLIDSSVLSELTKTLRFEVPDPYGDDDYECENEIQYDATKHKIWQVFYNENRALNFEYDYGDGWEISLTIKKIERIEISAADLPRVLEGEGFGIIEDCGGAYGLEELAKVFKKKSGNRYKELSRWLGVSDLDLSSFDINDINFRLKKIPRIYKEVYEYGYEPTQRSIDLIERKYMK